MIEIKKSHEGLFTDFAKSLGMSVQEAAKHVLANKSKYPRKRIEQAVFARNAKTKFNH